MKPWIRELKPVLDPWQKQWATKRKKQHQPGPNRLRTFRIGEREFDRWKIAARMAGTTVSEMVRDAVNARVEQVIGPPIPKKPKDGFRCPVCREEQHAYCTGFYMGKRCNCICQPDDESWDETLERQRRLREKREKEKGSGDSGSGEMRQDAGVVGDVRKA